MTDEVLLQYECSTDTDIDRRMIVVVSGGEFIHMDREGIFDTDLGYSDVRCTWRYC